MNKHQKTDCVINAKCCPFVTLTESKIPNVWYHNEFDALFCLTASGFNIIKGSKKVLFEQGMGRG